MLILAEELVPGDILLLEAGNRIPADAAEAALIGESRVVTKTPEAVAETSVLAAVVASSVLFLEKARKLLQKILSSKGECYA